MEKLDIQLMLDKAYNMDYLEMIEFISEEEKEYKVSDFYKKTKMPIFELCKNYFIYREQRYDFAERLNKMIENIDTDYLAKKIDNLFAQVEQGDSVNKFLEKIYNAFDIKQLLDNGEELKNLFNSIKQ